MAPIRYNPADWTGDVTGSASYKLGQALTSTPVEQWPAAIYQDIKQKPFKYSGIGYILADGFIALAGGLAKDPFMLTAAGIGTILNCAIIARGYGGDPTKLTPEQQKKNDRFENNALKITALLLGPLYMLGGVYGHSPELWQDFGSYIHKVIHTIPLHGEVIWSQIALGLATSVGAAFGLRKEKTNPSEFADVLRAAAGTCTAVGKAVNFVLKNPSAPAKTTRQKFDLAMYKLKETYEVGRRLPPFKMAGITWLTFATPTLIPEFIALHNNPAIFLAIPFYIGSNLLICISKKSDMPQPQETRLPRSPVAINTDPPQP